MKSDLLPGEMEHRGLTVGVDTDFTLPGEEQGVLAGPSPLEDQGSISSVALAVTRSVD